MASVIRLTLPTPPYTGNNQYAGMGKHRHLKPAIQHWRTAVGWLVRCDDVQPLEGDVEVRAVIYRADRRTDGTNIMKVVEDALQGYCYANDRQIKRETWEVRWDVEPRIEIEITPLGVTHDA